VKGIADGLAYLHKEGVVHGDLKSDNVLISPSGAPLLCNFETCRLISTHSLIMFGELLGSVPWMAYELLAPQINVGTIFETKLTDIWAFGMVVNELLTKEHPFPRHSIPQVVVAIVMGHLPGPPSNLQSRNIDKALWDLCTRCWNRVPTLRPVMTDMVREINDRNFVS
ncbi:kinase-like protein, partial [Rickenella mellea]